MGETNYQPIGDVINTANTGLDAIKRAPIVDYDTGIKCLRIQDVSQTKEYKDWGFTQVEQKNYDKFQLRKDDLIVARTGASIGVNKFIKNDLISVFNNGLIRIRIDKNKCVPKYLYYNFRTAAYEGFIDSISGGTSTQPNMQIKALLSYEIYVPPLPEQKAIASVLSSLDDKIDLLHHQNKTLEAMAETLFRQWFVEEAQEDWEEKRLADFADHIKINVKPASNPMQIYTHYSLPAFDEGMKPVVEAGNEILSNKYATEPWTMLVSKLNPRFPRIWPIGDSPGENAICSTEFQVFKPKNEKLYGYLYYLLKSKDAREELEMASSGTSGSHQRVRPEDIQNIKTILPSINLAEQYSEIVMPGIKKLMANIEQIHSLEKLRDTLLPKLMSGEVPVQYDKKVAT